jgi:hypothetical protein
MLRQRTLGALCCVLLASTSARAECRWMPFDPSCSSSRDERVQRHDGFYLRYANGPGLLVDSIDAGAAGSARLSGLGLTGEFLVGGTPAPGVVLFAGSAGALVPSRSAGALVPSPKLTIDGRAVDGPDVLSLSILGAGADYYFDPEAGWHVQGMLGFATLVPISGGDIGDARSGVGLVLGGGHEWWIGEEWSLGILARVAYCRLGYTDLDLRERHHLFVPGLIGALTYH